MSRALYFAYGSNMDHRQLTRRCGSATFLHAARLENHRFAFTRRSQKRRCGVLDVLPCEGSQVWGGLFELHEAELPDLDICEAVHVGGYRRICRDIVHADNGERISAVYAYEVVNKLPRFVPPSAHYMKLVLRGGLACGLPADYLDQLRRVPLQTQMHPPAAA